MSSLIRYLTPGQLDYVLFGLLALLWGSSYLLIKIAVSSIPPVTVIAMRVGVACLVLVAVLKWRNLTLPINPIIWRQFGVQSMLSGTGAWTLLAWGQQYVDSGLAGVLNSTSPVFVFFITLLITRHESVSVIKFLGAVLGLTGVALILGIGAVQNLGQQFIAQASILLSAVLYACAAIYGKRFSSINPIVTATGTMLCVALVVIPASLMLDRPWEISTESSSLLAAVVLGIFCTAVAMLIYFRLVQSMGSMGVASQAYLRAAVSVVLGMVFLGERLTQEILLGVGCALLGVALINGQFRRRVSEPD